MPTATNDQKIAAMYTAVFDRAPEFAGLEHWRGDFANGADVYDVASNFAAHEAFTTIYGEMTSEAFITALYTNVLGGAGDTDGMQYWVDQLEVEGKDRSVVFADFVVSSLETDLDAMLAAGEIDQVSPPV